MKEQLSPFEMPSDMSKMMTQGVEQAHKAVDSYFQFIQRGMPATPWAGGDLSKKLGAYAEQNVARAFAFAQRLIAAKDLQELFQIQAEFLQTQIQALSDQAKDISETATKTATTTFKGPSMPSS